MEYLWTVTLIRPLWIGIRGYARNNNGRRKVIRSIWDSVIDNDFYIEVIALVAF